MNEQQRFLLTSKKKEIAQDLMVADVFSYLQSKLVLKYEDVEVIKLESTSRQQTEKLISVLLSKNKNVADVFSYLQSKLVLKYEDVEVIKLESTSRQQTEKLISVLLSKNKNVFRHIYDALKYSEYHHLAELIESGLDDDVENASDDSEEEDLADIGTMLRDGGVPQLPPIFVRRPECLKEVENALYELRDKDGWVVLHGMGGSGKTVLAADVLHNEELVHTCFPGGIYWVTIGRVDEMRLLMKMQNLCSWLDPDKDYISPKNLEEARDRLRILFSHEHPRSLLVLDDLWLATDAKYFDIRVRTLVTTRYSSVASKISGLVIKVPVSESLSTIQSQQILAKWTNTELDKLPPEAHLIISECKGSPLAISMIGALLKGHLNRWSYYLQQLRQQKTSKVKSKLAYQYPSLYDALMVSFEHLPDELKKLYEMFSVFEEDVPIPLSVIAIHWDMEDVEVEDYLDELIERSLLHSNSLDEKPSYNVHDIQLSFLKEKAEKERTLQGYHAMLVDRYSSQSNNDFSALNNDDYIHWYLILHLLNADKVSLAITLLQDFSWIEVSSFITGPAPLISSYKQVIKAAESESNSQNVIKKLTDICHLISTQSHILSSSSKIDFTQLALSRPTSQFLYELAYTNAIKCLNAIPYAPRIYYHWINRPEQLEAGILLTSQFHNGPVNSCRFSHSKESSLVVTCGVDKLIKVWHSVTGKEIMTLEGHSDVVNFCEFSPDDEKIISCGNDYKIKIWSVLSGKELLSLQGHKNDILCCKCSTNGKYIVSASIDKTVKVWNMENGYLRGIFKDHTDVVNWCCFSPNDKYIASCSNDLTLKIWDSEKNKLLFTCGGDKDFIPFCLFTPDGKGVLSASQHFIQIFSLDTGLPIWSLATPCDVLAMAYSPNNRYLALAHNDMAARLFDLENEVFVQTYSGHSSWLNDVSFSMDGDSIATASADGMCKIWEVKPCVYSTEKLRKVFDVKFTDIDSPVTVAATNKNQVKLLQPNNTTVESQSFDSKISLCAFSMDMKSVAIGLCNGEITILKCASMEVLSKLKNHTDRINCLCYGCDILLSASTDCTCVVWSLTDFSVLSVFADHKETITKCFLYDGDKKAVSSSFDGSMLVWETRGGLLLFKCCHDDNAVMSCTLSHNEQFLLSCSADSTCKLWRADDGSHLLTADDHSDVIRCIAFSNDDAMFATGSDDGSVKIWRTNDGNAICECSPHELWVVDVKFNHTNDVIITISDDLKWFDLNGNLLQTYSILGSYLRSLSCTPNFETCVTIDNLGYFYVLKRIESNGR